MTCSESLNEIVIDCYVGGPNATILKDLNTVVHITYYVITC